MAGDVENIILRQVQEIRATLSEHGQTLKDQTDELRALRKGMHDWQETIATTSGFAMHANLHNQRLEEEIVSIKRLDMLEHAR